MSQVGEKASASRMSLFLRGSAFDLLLVLAASTALVFTLSYGFYSAPDLRGNVMLEAGLCLLLLIPMFAGGWSKKALVPAIAITVVLSIGIIVGFCMAMPEGTSLFVDGSVNDSAENYAVFAIVIVVVTVLTYLLSRRTAGLYFLLLFAVVACGAIQFLYRDWITENPGIPAFLVVLVCVSMMFVYQTYRSSIYHAKRVKKPAFAAVFGFSGLIALVCVGVGCIVFFGIVNALGIPTPDIKPFKNYYQRPVIEYSGVYTQQQIDNPDLFTSQLSDEWKDTMRQADGGGEVNAPDQEISSNPLLGLAQQLQAFDASDWAEQFNTLGYNITTPQGISVIVLLLLAIVALILFWRYRRVLRLRKWQQLPPSEEVILIYEFLVERFRRMKVRRAPNLTPLEHALASRHALSTFSHNTGGVDMFHLTLLYQRVFYGEAEVSKEQVESFERYYKAFFKNAKEYSGGLKWALWRFWRI